MILLDIDVTKIPKERIKLPAPGKKGKYLKLKLVEHPNDRGDDGFIACQVSKEERTAGVKGEIVGNWKHSGGGGGQQRQQAPTDETGDIAF